MKTRLSSWLPVGGLLLTAIVAPGQALALAYHNGADITASSTVHNPAYGFLDGVGYVLTENPSAGNYLACSGTALSSRIILTASHCFDFNYDNTTDNARTSFYSWEGSGASRNFSLHGGSVIASPQREITLAGGYKAYSDVALIVLDTPLSESTPTYAVYSGDLTPGALASLEGGAMVVGYGRHHEEGQFIEYGGVDKRWVGYTQIDGYDPQKGGTLSASLIPGGATLAPGDSGGPLMSWTQSGGAPMGVIFGVGAYARDVQGNGSYADLGDEAYWSFVGSQTDFIRQVAAQHGETVRFYGSSPLLACLRESGTCPTSGVGSVPGVPEPSEWALLAAGLFSLTAAGSRRGRKA